MLRAFRLVGPGAGQVLDLLHVHADVRGALEEEGAVTVWLVGALPDRELPGVVVEELTSAAANASATGLEDDRPILVAPDLLVRPPWIAGHADFHGIELVVPRGMAFGSGEHASTQAALLAMHAVWNAPASFADVGTGSGILACYAHQRGCARIAACDLEAGAVQAARELLPEAEIVLGGPEQLSCAADFVVANLTAAEHHAALAAVLAKWTRRAPLVLSGMRVDEVAAVAARLPAPSAHRVQVGAFVAIALLGHPAAMR